MKKYNCEYCNSVRLNIGDKWQMKIEAANPKEAYEKFIEKVGRYPEEVIVDIWWGLHSEIFDDHIEASKQRIHEKGKSEGDQRESQERAAKVGSTELADILEMLKQIDSNIKSYGSRILWMLFVIAMGIMGIKLLLG